MCGGQFMRFMFRKKRYKHEKSIDDLKKEYDKNGEYRHIVVNDKNIPLWCCKTRQEAVEQVVEEWFWNFTKCEIVDLLLYIPRSKQKGVVMMKMTFDEKKEEIRKNIEELKEDIKILNKNISEFESVLDKVNSFDEMEQYKEMDIEKGLKHIEIF